MKSKRGLFVAIVVAFLAGLALPTMILWNPVRWEWADRLAGRAGGPESETSGKIGRQLWTCGMHPQVIQDEPGNCPICGMKLVSVKSAERARVGTTTENKERKIKYWRAPMDPNYISDKPGKSPMGMDLVPVYEDEEPAESGIRVDPSFLQNFAVRTVVAEKGSIPIEIRTVGILAYNEKNIVSVNTKFEGWIEKAHVNYVGERIRKGQVLFEIYSPQLVTTQQEYLAAIDYLEKLSGGKYPDAVERARSLLEATRERLRYWDVSDEQIEELRRSGKITRTLEIVSPVSGIVISKMSDSLEGMKLTPGMNVYKIANLSTVWAEIEVFEHQIQHVRLGQRAQITVDAFPGRTLIGKIIYIDPTMNPQTRTLKAYVEVPNPNWKLRPEMYANVEIRVPAVFGTVKVPEEAVIHSGERSVVIVQKAKGIFEPREVELGAVGGGYTAVRHGLQSGETVVTSSQFLIDSESNLKEAISKMLARRQGEGEPQAAPPTARQH
jgi:Cu(I)/Ag(I) efflux system membrane fusion protein/cobalt-zinc-cadmium efflux system membrane fusion protein